MQELERCSVSPGCRRRLLFSTLASKVESAARHKLGVAAVEESQRSDSVCRAFPVRVGLAISPTVFFFFCKLAKKKKKKVQTKKKKLHNLRFSQPVPPVRATPGAL